MNIFYNNCQKLTFENNRELEKLSPSNWDTIENMIKYMDSFHLSLFELEVIKKDLIGMAGEAQLEGIDFLDKIGMSEKDFCDSLIENAAKQSAAERLLPVARNFMLTVFGFYTLTWLLEGTPEHFGITNWLIFFACVIGALTLLDNLLCKRSTYLDKRKRKMVRTIDFLLLLALNVTITVIWPGKDNYFPEVVSERFLMTGSGSVIFSVLLVLALLVFLGNNYYFNKCSDKYRWE